MTRLRTFLHSPSGAAAAEFALVLPIALLFFFGIIDMGRYVWRINELEKAVQMGARYAVATDVVANRLAAMDYGDPGIVCPNADTGTDEVLAPGDTICANAQGTVTCDKSSGSLECTCAPTSVGAASCQGDDEDVDEAAFDSIVSRMRVVAPFIADDEVVIKYDGSGIGFAGDPATDDDGNDLSDTAPIVTVGTTSGTMRMLFLLGGTVPLPPFSYSQTLEDGDGTVAY